MTRINVVAVSALLGFLYACGGKSSSPTAPAPPAPQPPVTQPPPVVNNTCPNEEFNEYDGEVQDEAHLRVHLKVKHKPACGQALRVGTMPNDINPPNKFEIEVKQNVYDVGYFNVWLTQSPIGTALDQMELFKGNQWPWNNLGTRTGGFPRNQMGTLNFRGALSPGIPSDQKPVLTYLLVTLQSSQSFGWVGNGPGLCQPNAGCNVWQQAIKLDIPIID